MTQNEILDWDVKGFNITYKCIDDSGIKNCVTKEINISNAEATSFTAKNLMQYTNYTFTVSVYNLVAEGLKSTINVETEKMKSKFMPYQVFEDGPLNSFLTFINLLFDYLIFNFSLLVKLRIF